MMMTNEISHPHWIRWFSEINLDHTAAVGGKNASLGELYRELRPKGILVPDGFAITVEAYWKFIDVNQLREPIEQILRNLNLNDIENLRTSAQKIRQLISSAKLPHDIESEIVTAYDHLTKGRGPRIDVAVRSSATAEDLPEASFAGQQETYLNIRGHLQLLDACKRCFASLFTDRAISYRTHMKVDHFGVGLSVGIQPMIRSDLGSAGVMFTIDTESGFKDVVLINASYGLGETVVQGSVVPDEYYVFKPTLQSGHRPILQKKIGSKEFKLIYDIGGEKHLKPVSVPENERMVAAISDEDILQLARWGALIEEHYSRHFGHPQPMDIEWAKDGETGELYIVQARPETVQSQRNAKLMRTHKLLKKSKALLEGKSIGSKIGTGQVRVIHDIRQAESLLPGEILVAERTDPDWEPILKKASAVVTDQGGRTCHAAIVSRELGIPAIVGTERGTTILKTGQPVTVSCAEGEVGTVYDGVLEYRIEEVDISSLPRPKTKIMMNIANPNEALHLSQLPVDGVGLAREEFIINEFVKIHPMALVHFSELPPSAESDTIAKWTATYADKSLYFVDRLAQGISMLAAAFYPRDVILRFSDFKSNEYSHLLGGQYFEPKEENPMLGFRGASRYYHDLYREGFALECRAVQKVRLEMGLNNLKVMIPFCRTVEEARSVLSEMSRYGLARGQDGLQIYLMCEIPSNVILAEQFADLFDGFSIGSNDLTQLVLGVDRDSELLAPLFDERNDAVKAMISQAIQAARLHGRRIGICGQAPSDYPEFIYFLISEGIDSISVSSDAVLRTVQLAVAAERKISRHRTTTEHRLEQPVH